MSPCRSPFVLLATPRPGLAALFAFGLLGLIATPLAADELLHPGPWKGEYRPADLGEDIDASFCFQRDDTRTPPWKVTMRLKLIPPGEQTVEFEDLKVEGEALTFRFDLLGVQRECVLKEKGEDKLTFKCRSVDDVEKKVTLTMRKAIPLPDDQCQQVGTGHPPEPTVEDEPEPAAPDPS